jgi:alkylation response protein AidB-like acyl-CoA dehydrogenase
LPIEPPWRISIAPEQVVDSYGYDKDLPVEKYYGDAKFCMIGEGTSEIQRLVISREV